VVALSGFGAAAFGTASLAPDAALLPQRLVSQPVEVAGIESQLEALAAHDLQLSRSDITRANDTPAGLLGRLGVSDDEAVAFLRRDPAARKLLQGRVGKPVQVRADGKGALQELVARYPAERADQLQTHFTRLTIQRVDGQLRSHVETDRLEPRVRLGSGTIRSALFVAIEEARMPDSVGTQIAEIFATEIDFHREIRKGDTFSVVYEALTADGEPVPWVEGGRVLAAEFVNGGKAYQAVWFAGANGKGAYFSPDGQSRQRSFLASPMEFSRITSGFAMRFHPLQRSWRQHLGVDYAAPHGTPVRTIGDGVVTFAGWQGGYGNVVEVQHGGDKTTLYAHLSRIEVTKGSNVAQGQRIGAVGATGWATGPHLHFEFRVNGQHQDPLTLARQSDTVRLDPVSRQDFLAAAQRAQVKLDLAESLAGSRVASFE
jgi:murein DD-endopeptidase MepM/ murein hydrolase activator NlpD